MPGCRPAGTVATAATSARAAARGVAIAEVLRTRMYDVDYGDPLLARTEYATLGNPARACLSCAHQSCLNACTNGIPIAEFTRDAATRLGERRWAQ